MVGWENLNGAVTAQPMREQSAQGPDTVGLELTLSHPLQRTGDFGSGDHWGEELDLTLQNQRPVWLDCLDHIGAVQLR